MARRAEDLRAGGSAPALVPTMGSLHEGHLSLIRLAATLSPAVVVSVFVNPTQFGPGEDFARYPRNLEADTRLAGSAGAGIVFAPEAADMYPEGFQTHVEVEEITRRLCGARRPGHFRGVATVVLKLFNIVRPGAAVFGEKDYQQLAVIRRMTRDLNLPVAIVAHPLVREADGLAMSSRNAYLAPDERIRAIALNRALGRGREAILSGERSAEAVRRAMTRVLDEAGGIGIEYVSVADPESLEEAREITGRTLLALAVKIGPTRLIDNMVVSPI